MTDSPPVRVQFANEFKVELRTLAKRYRQIRTDLQPLIEQLQAGELPGDQISGTGYTVFKVRIKNSDICKGKSAGYRIIYQILSPTSVLLLLIYAKSDRTGVSTKEIQAVIKKFQSDQAQ
ncbi:MAG: type II toxin-antitoxin system RelE/ParE family toxin [Cyanobacteria bacterium CRU_2_1]|nr:type II toxin-antitoxin system RelE/ParE family toxin [Cyanobacteria bacterium RU_5_0]NJR60948.1 type II toxin-antitoxin system RelE/ParE family toxin [Cyanobacteria bacterium CRU_2_1]